MIDLGKKNVLGVLVDAVDYESAVLRILAAAQSRSPLSVTALAAHGVMTGFQDRTHRYRLNRIDLVTPDGQPVRWAMNRLHRTALPDRVYGPNLMLAVCAAAAREHLGVFLYGSRPEVLSALVERIHARFPDLPIAGAEPSSFRAQSPEETAGLVRRIRQSGARIVFVGLGCPRQEIFVHHLRDRLDMPLIAVGAAFDYHSGFASEPPQWMQKAGLQWLHRFASEPLRLWHRYLILNPLFLLHLALQIAGLRRADPADTQAPVSGLLPG